MKLISPQLLALSSILLGLTGCGSDNKAEPEPVAAIQKISGVAVDGYLAMAKACIDLNNNFQCDGDSEYQVLTDQDGRFEIVAPEELTVKAPLLVTTSAGVSIDSDYPEKTIEQAYYLLSDYKKPEVVSPLTTLVYAKMQTLGNKTQAEQVLVQQLGLIDSSMLYSDFVAAKNDLNLTTEQRKKYSDLHTLSQVITDIIAQGLAQSTSNTSDEERPQVSKLFTDKLADLPIEEINEQVNNAISTGDEINTLAELFLQNTPSLIVSKNEVDNGKITPVIIPDPVTPDPVTPDPVTPDPVTPDPVTPDPATPDPVTPDPVTPDPVTPDPVTPAPVTPPTIMNPSAPTNAVVNDAANTFGWTLVTGYSQISDYQYSSDNGTNWHDVNANPLLLTNQYYPAGTVQVRVKADSKTSRNAGAILASSTAYYLVPIAPNNGAVTNGDVGTSSTFAFDLVPDFSKLSNYQYSSDNGKTWQAVTVNPIVLTEKTYAINQVQVRVTNNLAAGNLAGTTLSNQEAFTPNLGPAPKAVTIQYMYKNNGIRWEMLGQFPEIEHYEYTNNKGVTWQDATSKTQHVGHQAYARADVGVRVKELANGQGAAAGEISWVADSDDDSLFVALPYTWMNKAKESESLTTYGSWNTSETSCLIDHNAPTPTYWIKINSSYGSDAETKITEAINKKACGISDWQLLSESELITLAQTEADSELADFEGSYDKFFTKNDSDQLIMIKNAVVQGSYSSYESAGILLRWQYPGASQAIIKINALVTKLQTEIASNTSDYDTARLDADALLASYTSATSVANYLAINNNLVASQTSLTTGTTLVNAQLVTSTNDINSLSFLASFVSQDTLATAVEKQAAQAAVTLATTELTKQQNNDEQLISLQQQLSQLEQTLININAALASKTDLDSSTAALTTAHASYPAAINALGGSEQYNLAMQAATSWYQVNEQFTLANKQLSQYQSLLNALPSALHVDALAELTLTQSNLDAAVLPFSEAGFINDHQSIKQAFETAYQAGFVTTVADAMVGTHFAKLDLAGHYMPTSATFQQGWRCVTDLRHNDKGRIWSLMEKGTSGSIDNVAYAGGSGQNLTEADGLQEQYNSNAICGFSDWTIPTPDLLASLATADYSDSKKTIDITAFPHHQGASIEDYFYWSNQSASSNTQHAAYEYSGTESGYSNNRNISNQGDQNYLTFARLYRQKQQQLLDNDGNVVTDIADAFCAKDQSGLIWQLPKTADVSSRYQTVAKITGLNDDGTVESNNIANELNTAPQPLCGKTNWQLPTLAQLQSLYTSPLNHDFFQHWTVSSDDSNDKDYYLARDIGSYSRNRCLSLNGSENSSSCSRKSYNGAPPYQYTYMMISEPTKAAPAAPTNGVVVDSADINSFGWDYVSGFPTPSDYQYTIDGGIKWYDVSNNPQALNDAKIAIGDMQVRIKAQPTEYFPTGEALQAQQEYISQSGCIGYQDNGLCYTIVNEGKTHDDAIAHCLSLGAALISKDTSIDWTAMEAGLSMDRSLQYWLKEKDSWPSYAYSIRVSSGVWNVDYASKNVSTNQGFICVK
ncbi:DUF1566 domain-containing protein [Colwellia psychrerythraea]|uniref:Lcl C-terminal domain-containing protein n=1 Tax=Colwellia psychrerythraea TaxID=28229 RepID=A0A099KNI4_COLPS|nr:DUF1566 domain-containing protein [Colwellia psychrerythraea]KGJ91178.1 hypothetical protein GAB14E_3330 [Colwellia psychrerythraea]